MENFDVSNSDIKKENNLCHGCLSSDRNLSVLDDNRVLFCQLLGPELSSNIPNVQCNLCWECVAMLRNVRKFQIRIQAAQNLLQEVWYQFYNTSSLSTLNINFINNINIFGDIHITKEIQKPVSGNICRVTQTIETPIEFTPNICKEECEVELDLKELKSFITNTDVKDEIDFDDEFDSVEKESLHEEDINISSSLKKEPKNKKVKQSPKANIKRKKETKCESIVTINKNKIDSTNINTYFVIKRLSNEEMDMFVKSQIKKVYKLNKCDVCKCGYTTVVDLQRHKMLQHFEQNQVYTCEKCNIEVKTYKELQNHWLSHNEAASCVFCNKLVIACYQSMYSHIRAHRSICECTDCGQSFSTRELANAHGPRCDICGAKSTCKRAIAKHMRRRHQVEYKCEVCPAVYPDYQKLQNHIGRCHKPRPPPDRDSCYCVECDRLFATPYKYRLHLKTSVKHTPPVKVSLPCADCGKVFAKRSNLNNHRRLFHEKSSKHYCSICDKQFATGYGARKHKMFVHDKVAKTKTKECDLCGRMFNTNRILVNHRRTHTGERPFACALCPLAFTQHNALQSHARTQHGGGGGKLRDAHR